MRIDWEIVSVLGMSLTGGGAAAAASRRSSTKALSRVKMEVEEVPEHEEEEVEEDRGGVTSDDDNGSWSEEEGASKGIQEFGCKFCSVKFDLSNDEKHKKLQAMQRHIQKCQQYYNKRMKEDMRTAGQCREEMPSQAAKALESSLTVPDPTFLISGIQEWLTGPRSRVPPVSLMNAIFTSLRETKCAQRAQCFYRMMCLSLEAHPPHVVLNAWSVADLNVFNDVIQAVSVLEDPMNYRMVRSNALALAVLLKVFKVGKIT